MTVVNTLSQRAEKKSSGRVVVLGYAVSNIILNREPYNHGNCIGCEVLPKRGKIDFVGHLSGLSDGSGKNHERHRVHKQGCIVGIYDLRKEILQVDEHISRIGSN